MKSNPPGVAGARVRLASAVRQSHGTWRGWVRSMLAQLEFLTGRLTPWTVAQLSGQRPHRYVFVCLGNINRSAFAAEVARRCGLHCASIGLSTATGLPAYEKAIVQAAAMGYDLTAHRATHIADYGWQEGDLLFAMEVRHVRWMIDSGIPSSAIALLGFWAAPQRIHLHDPHTLSDEYFATCFTLIESAVRRLSMSMGQGSGGQWESPQ